MSINNSSKCSFKEQYKFYIYCYIQMGVYYLLTISLRIVETQSNKPKVEYSRI